MTSWTIVGEWSDVADFKLTRPMWIFIAVWVVGLVALGLVTALVEVDGTFAGGMLGAWCGVAIAAVMVVYERSKKKPVDKLSRERYGRR